MNICSYVKLESQSQVLFNPKNLVLWFRSERIGSVKHPKKCLFIPSKTGKFEVSPAMAGLRYSVNFILIDGA